MYDVAIRKRTFPSMENSMHLSCIVHELQWWQRVFWNSSFRLGFLTWWRCLTQCLDRWASSMVHKEGLWRLYSSIFPVRIGNRSETDGFWCFHLLRYRWIGFVWCLRMQCAAECRGGSWEYRSETWADLKWCETLWLRQQFLDALFDLVWCRLAKQLSLAEHLMLLNFSPLTADQQTKGTCLISIVKIGLCCGWFVCKLARVGFAAFEQLKWLSKCFRPMLHLSCRCNAVMTTCLLEFLVSLRVLNLMAMFGTMSGPLSKQHGAQRRVVASLFFDFSCEDWK